MLENITKVDWVALDFPEIPRLLLNLTSEEKGIRDRAYDELYDAELPELQPKATSAIIPFLIELLRQSSVKDKDVLILLLAQISCNALAYAKQRPSRRSLKDVIDALQQGLDIYIILAREPNMFEYGSLLLTCLQDMPVL